MINVLVKVNESAEGPLNPLIVIISKLKIRHKIQLVEVTDIENDIRVRGIQVVFVDVEQGHVQSFQEVSKGIVYAQVDLLIGIQVVFVELKGIHLGAEEPGVGGICSEVFPPEV